MSHGGAFEPSRRVSDHTLKRAAYLDAHAPPTLKAELLAGATSINAAFMAVRRDTK